MKAPLIVSLAIAAACGSAGADDGSPYVLRIDRALYTLSIPRAASPAFAAGGSSHTPSAPDEAPLAPTRSALAQLQDRERAYEQRIAELVRERDRWRMYAFQLESDPRLRSGTAPLNLPPPALLR